MIDGRDDYDVSFEPYEKIGLVPANSHTVNCIILVLLSIVLFVVTWLLSSILLGCISALTLVVGVIEGIRGRHSKEGDD